MFNALLLSPQKGKKTSKQNIWSFVQYGGEKKGQEVRHVQTCVKNKEDRGFLFRSYTKIKTTTVIVSPTVSYLQCL